MKQSRRKNNAPPIEQVSPSLDTPPPSLVTPHSSLLTRRSSLVTRPSSLVPRHLSLFLVSACTLLLLWAVPMPSLALAATEDKQENTDAKEAVKQEPPKPRPPFDPEKLPDPFVSYFIRSQRNEALDLERRKREQIEREEKLKQEQIAAERKLQEMKDPKTELQRLELSQLTLTAIIQGNGTQWAMVRDPRGMGYILKKDIAIGTNGGVIKKIAYRDRRVVIDEPYLTEDFKLQFKEVELKLQDELFE